MSPGDQLSFADDDFVRDRVDDVGPADPASNRLGQADFDLFTAIQHAAGHSLVVPQSCVVTTMFWQMSASLRVR